MPATALNEAHSQTIPRIRILPPSLSHPTAQLLQRDLQLRAGTKEFNDGIRRMAEAEEKSRKYWRAIHGAGTKKPRRATSKRQTRKSDEPPVS